MISWLVKLKFTSPLHVGEFGFGEEMISSSLRSDTIWSALCVACESLFGAERCAEWIQRVQDVPGTCRVSSAFPFIEDTLFLPRPMMYPQGFEDVEFRMTWSKEVKKTPYLSSVMFQKWIRNELIQDAEMEQVMRERDEVLASSSVRTLPRVALDRTDSNSQLYMQAQQVFAKGSGMYLLIQSDERDVSWLQACFRWLSDNGIGGKRSIGYGLFEPEFQMEGDWQELLVGAERANAHLLLSLYYPQDEERRHDWQTASLLWADRRGWSRGSHGGSLKRAAVRMIAEGSVLPFPPQGQLVDVTPTGLYAENQPFWTADHAVYRSGIALSIPVRNLRRSET